MITVAIALIIMVSVVVVAYPLIRSVPDAGVPFVGLIDPMLDNLIAQRDSTYAAIKDLEFDHTMGKLSDHDYKILRAKYEGKAVAILQELDSLSATQKSSAGLLSKDQVIERQVERLRRGAADSVSKCPQCGTPCATGDVFCAKCGTSFRGARCSVCGTRASLGDKFCAKCGKPI
jgi:hypothetical protein